MKRSEKEAFIESYAQALAEHFGIAPQGLQGQELFNFVVTEVLLRTDETSVELLRMMRKATE